MPFSVNPAPRCGDSGRQKMACRYQSSQTGLRTLLAVKIRCAKEKCGQTAGEGAVLLGDAGYNSVTVTTI